jgi:acyl carrier protein
MTTPVDTTPILEFICKELLLEKIEINETTSLFENKILDSMNLSELIVFIEHTFRIRVAPSEVIFENLDSVKQIVGFIEKKLL